MYGCEIVYANGNQTNVVLGIRPVLYQESDQYYIGNETCYHIGNETQHCIGNETSMILGMRPVWYWKCNQHGIVQYLWQVLSRSIM